MKYKVVTTQYNTRSQFSRSVEDLMEAPTLEDLVERLEKGVARDYSESLLDGVRAEDLVNDWTRFVINDGEYSFDVRDCEARRYPTQAG